MVFKLEFSVALSGHPSNSLTNIVSTPKGFAANARTRDHARSRSVEVFNTEFNGGCGATFLNDRVQTGNV
jgi:hypothetical protein